MPPPPAEIAHSSTPEWRHIAWLMTVEVYGSGMKQSAAFTGDWMSPNSVS